MFSSQSDDGHRDDVMAYADVNTRATFITRTYMHLLGAILAFVALEIFLFSAGIAESFGQMILSGGNIAWMMVLGGAMVGGWLATSFAHNARSAFGQYFGLGIYVVIEAIIFMPILYIANSHFHGVIESAAMVTLLAFGALTAVVFITRKDFSFLRGVIMYGFMLAVIAIIAALIFGFELGTFFSIAMVGLAGAAILYNTSNVLHHYPEDRYVGAALQLFASVMLMFWYILQLFMSRD